MPVVQAKFTVDGTYSSNQRIDAMGGSNGNSFFLKNGGFFNTVVSPGTMFTVTNGNAAPAIDLTTLP
ncbi:hypothetical protein D3C81_2031140 [compost metagenome]